MNKPTAESFLHDARAAIEEIIAFTADLDQPAFLTSRGTQLIVERLFITLGEALSRALRTDPTLTGTIPEVREIIAMRHILVHNYGQVDLQILWNAIEFEIRPLDGALAVALGLS